MIYCDALKTRPMKVVFVYFMNVVNTKEDYYLCDRIRITQL